MIIKVCASDPYATQHHTHPKRWEEWADLLDSVPRARFDMSVWGGPTGKSTTFDEALKKLRKPLSEDMDFTEKCGTAACALGWAAQYRPFTKRGLRFDYHDTQVVYGPEGSWWRKSGCSACSEFFQLPERVSGWLVSPAEYLGVKKVTPKRVARRLRKLVAYRKKHGNLINFEFSCWD